MSDPLNALDVCVLLREKYLILVKMIKSTNILKSQWGLEDISLVDSFSGVHKTLGSTPITAKVN